MRATRHIVTTGEALRRQLIEENGFDADRITSIPTGIATDHFVPGDQAAARGRAGTAAECAADRHRRHAAQLEGPRYLLEAFARLPRERLGLVIVGDGPQREAIEARIRELGSATV